MTSLYLSYKVRNRHTENEKTVRIFNPFSISPNQYDAIKRIEEVLRAVLQSI